MRKFEVRAEENQTKDRFPRSGCGATTARNPDPCPQDRLLNLRLAEEIDEATFASKHTEMRDRLASIKLQLNMLDRSQDETADLAARVFELSQTIRQQWLTADYNAKRRILEIICLNCRLDGATLVPERRKPSRLAGRRARF